MTMMEDRDFRSRIIERLVRPAMLGIVAVALAAGGCRSTDHSEFNLLGEHERVAGKSNEFLGQKEPQPNQDVVAESPGIYDTEFQVDTLNNTVYISYPVRNMDAGQLKKALASQLPSDYVEQISVVDNTNTLLLRISQEQTQKEGQQNKRSYKELMQTVRSLDKRPPQIMVDVHIYRIFGDYTRDIAALLQAESGTSDQFAPSLDVDLPGAELRSPQRAEIGGQYGLIARYGATKVEAALDQLESHGYAEDVANPTLLVSNGKQAEIALVERIPIPRDVVEGDTVVQTTEFEEVENSLEVTPSVRANGLVQLQILGEISSIDLSGPSQVPNITTRKANIESVLLRQGQTLTVAGFINERSLAIDRQIPFLARIPLLGQLFRSEDREKEKTMILFTVSPSYVDVLKKPNKPEAEPHN